MLASNSRLGQEPVDHPLQHLSMHAHQGWYFGFPYAVTEVWAFGELHTLCMCPNAVRVACVAAEAVLRPVFNELCFNLESFNPAFTHCLLMVRKGSRGWRRAAEGGVTGQRPCGIWWGRRQNELRQTVMRSLPSSSAGHLCPYASTDPNPPLFTYR